MRRNHLVAPERSCPTGAGPRGSRLPAAAFNGLCGARGEAPLEGGGGGRLWERSEVKELNLRVVRLIRSRSGAVRRRQVGRVNAVDPPSALHPTCTSSS